MQGFPGVQASPGYTVRPRLKSKVMTVSATLVSVSLFGPAQGEGPMGVHQQGTAHVRSPDGPHCRAGRAWSPGSGPEPASGLGKSGLFSTDTKARENDTDSPRMDILSLGISSPFHDHWYLLSPW